MQWETIVTMWIGVAVVLWLLTKGKDKLKLTTQKQIIYILIAAILTGAFMTTVEKWNEPRSRSRGAQPRK